MIEFLETFKVYWVQYFDMAMPCYAISTIIFLQLIQWRVNIIGSLLVK
jgi:hypothetical protein